VTTLYDEAEVSADTPALPDGLLNEAAEQAASYTPGDLKANILGLSEMAALAKRSNPADGLEWVSGRNVFRTSRASTGSMFMHWNAQDVEALRRAESANPAIVLDAVRALDKISECSDGRGGQGPYARNTVPLGRCGLRAVVDKGWMLAYFVHLDQTRTGNDIWVAKAVLVDPRWRAKALR
jgi:hypothetical protein